MSSPLVLSGALRDAGRHLLGRALSYLVDGMRGHGLAATEVRFQCCGLLVPFGNDTQGQVAACRTCSFVLVYY